MLPARVRRPRDKAKVEVAVQVVRRWVLARLRHRRFFSLAEPNGAIRELVTDLNDRPMRHLATSRRARFEALERPALLPLPTEPYAYAESRRCRGGSITTVRRTGISIPCPIATAFSHLTCGTSHSLIP